MIGNAVLNWVHRKQSIMYFAYFVAIIEEFMLYLRDNWCGGGLIVVTQTLRSDFDLPS